MNRDTQTDIPKIFIGLALIMTVVGSFLPWLTFHLCLFPFCISSYDGQPNLFSFLGDVDQTLQNTLNGDSLGNTVNLYINWLRFTSYVILICFVVNLIVLFLAIRSYDVRFQRKMLKMAIVTSPIGFITILLAAVCCIPLMQSYAVDSTFAAWGMGNGLWITGLGFFVLTIAEFFQWVQLRSGNLPDDYRVI